MKRLTESVAVREQGFGKRLCDNAFLRAVQSGLTVSVNHLEIKESEEIGVREHYVAGVVPLGLLIDFVLVLDLSVVHIDAADIFHLRVPVLERVGAVRP